MTETEELLGVRQGEIDGLKAQIEQLRDFIILERDHFTAWASFEELGNYARFVKRAHLFFGDTIPELKELAEEVRYYEQQHEKRRLMHKKP